MVLRFDIKIIIINLIVLLGGCWSLSTAMAEVPLKKISHLFDISHDFLQPSDVEVAPDGKIYVVDGVNNAIKVFHKNGNFAFSFGVKGNRDGQLLFPLGIDIGDSGKVYVADSGNHRLQIFTARGKFLRKVVIPSVDGKKADPTDVAVDEKRNRCFVVDNDNHTIVTYELNSLKYLNNFGVPGGEKREFRYPFLIDIDASGFLYIVDVVNTRLQVFNSQGHFVNIIGGWGVEKGNFFRPKGVAVDQDGLVCVGDSYMNVIQVFQSNSWFHSVVANTATKKIHKFDSPVGISIDKNNRLYVVEMFANRVGVYQIEEQHEKGK